MESWHDILDDVINRKSPWMGHDPYPIIKYMENNTARIWSDDYIGIWKDCLSVEVKEKFHYIDYNYDDLVTSINDIERHLHGFATGPLYQWLQNIDEILAKKVVSRFCEWFNVEYNYIKEIWDI